MRPAKLILALATLASGLFAADLESGTWKLNLAKSKLIAPVSLASATMVIEPVDSQTHRVTFTPVAKDGQVRKMEEVRTCDGKERPSTSIPGTMIGCSGIGTATPQYWWTKDGKKVAEIRVEISADGKTLTNSATGVDYKGNLFEETRVWDKQ